MALVLVQAQQHHRQLSNLAWNVRSKPWSRTVKKAHDIAALAVAKPVTVGNWTIYTSASGKPYYHDNRTQEQVWEKPVELGGKPQAQRAHMTPQMVRRGVNCCTYVSCDGRVVV